MSFNSLLKHKLAKSKYENIDLFQKQIILAMESYRDLRPTMEKFVHDDGRETELFGLQGTIPIKFKDSKYNFPICVLLQTKHPYTYPIVYVRPTKSMVLRSTRYVDRSGRVYLPYITEWKHPGSDLETLLQILCCVFGEEPPVYSKDLSSVPNTLVGGPTVSYPDNKPIYPATLQYTPKKETKGKNDNVKELELDCSEENFNFSKPWKDSDAVLIIEGQSLHVHKIILGMSSTVFQAMFAKSSGMPCINLPRKNVTEFVDFLKQIYTLQFTAAITMKSVEYIYDLADEFQVKSVLNACRKFLTSQEITGDNIGKLLNLAERFSCEELSFKCKSRLKNLNFKALKDVQLDTQSLQNIVLPKAIRLEKCVEELLPQLLWFIDCAVYFWSNTTDKDLNTNTKRGMIAGKPKICERHYEVGKSVICEGPKTPAKLEHLEERLTCKMCMSMLDDMKRLSYQTFGGGNTPEDTLREIFEVLFPGNGQNDLVVCNNIQVLK